MKKMVKNLWMKLGGITALMALCVATASVNSTCFFTMYQPDPPVEL